MRFVVTCLSIFIGAFWGIVSAWGLSLSSINTLSPIVAFTLLLPASLSFATRGLIDLILGPSQGLGIIIPLAIFYGMLISFPIIFLLATGVIKMGLWLRRLVKI